MHLIFQSEYIAAQQRRIRRDARVAAFRKFLFLSVIIAFLAMMARALLS